MNVVQSRSGLRSETLTSEFGPFGEALAALVEFGRPQQTLLFLETCRSQVGFRERSRPGIRGGRRLWPLGSNRPSPPLSDGAFDLFL